MKTSINKLPKSSEALEKIIVDLTAQLANKQKIIDQSKAELSLYKEKYARLIEESRLAKQQRFSPSSEKNVLQPDLFDEAGIELSEEIKDQLSEEEVTVDSYDRKKHPVRKKLPTYLPREVILHDITEEEKICSCGEQRIRIGDEISEQLKYIPAKISVTQHVRPKYACKPCQENVKIAPIPLLLLPKSIATPELVAHTIISKYCDHLPLYRQEAIWERMEIDMPRSSLCGWVLKVAELCEPLVYQLRKNILAYDYAQADETIVQVLDEVGRSNQTKSYMCVTVVAEKRQRLFMSFRKHVEDTMRSNFSRILKGIYRQMLILVITGLMMTRILSLWAAIRMQDARLQSSRN